LNESETLAEALRNRGEYDGSVDAILQEDKNIAARIEQMEVTLEEETNSIRPLNDETIVKSRRASMTQPSSTVGNDTSDATATEMNVMAPDTLRINPQFETFLKSSRVYMRANANEVDMISVRGSTIQTSTSNALSAFSLNHISITSVFRLPITLDDITKIGSDLTFGKLMLGQALDGKGVPVEYLGKVERVHDDMSAVKYEPLSHSEGNDISLIVITGW
jgi:hypothetical protein